MNFGNFILVLGTPLFLDLFLFALPVLKKKSEVPIVSLLVIIVTVAISPASWEIGTFSALGVYAVLHYFIYFTKTVGAITKLIRKAKVSSSLD